MGVDAFNEDIDISVNDSNQYTDVSYMDSNKAISSNEVADTSVVDSTDLSTEVEKVNDQSIEDLDSDSSTAVSSSRSGSIAAACVLLAIVTIFVAMLLIYKQSCLCRSALGTNTWSPVNKDDFAIDMDDSEFDDKRSIIKNKNNVYA